MRLVRCSTLATTCAAALAIAAPAQAQLPALPEVPPLPDAGAIITETGQTVGGALPEGSGGVVTTTTGTVGGIVTGALGTVTTTVDEAIATVLDGAGGALPTGTLDSLLQTLLGSPGAGGGTGADGANGVNGAGTVVNGANGVIDGAAPTPTVKVLSRLTQIRKTGSLKLQIASDEAGLVVVGGAIRPGRAVKTKKQRARGSAKVKHSRKLIKFPAAVLAFRKAGALQVTVKLGKQARSTLGRSRNARISLALVAADIFKNQASSNVKRAIKR